MKRLIAAATAALALVAAPAANAAFGDNFGVAPLNDGAGPAQEAPALAPATHAYWAGACDRSAAPAFGQPIMPDTGPGAGYGTYSSTVFAPVNESSPFLAVPAPSTPADCLEWGSPADGGSSVLPWTHPPSWRLPAHTQAGGHFDGTTIFAFNRNTEGGMTNGSLIDGSVDNIVVELPPGLVGDPNAVAKCTARQFSNPLQCPPESQVGVLHLEIFAVFGAGNGPGGNSRIYPVYNLEPRRGNVAELGFGYASGENAVAVRIVAKARTNSDHGVTAFVGQIPGALQVRSQEITIWGVPWAASNDVWRAPSGLKSAGGACNFQPGGAAQSLYIPYSGLTAPGCAQHYDPSWGPIKPFFSNVTECTGEDLSTRLAMDAFQHPGNFVSDGRPLDPVSGKVGFTHGDPDYSDADWKVYDSPAPPMSGCEEVGFSPDITLTPKLQGGAANQVTDSPSGLDVELAIPQNDQAPIAVPPTGSSQPVVDQYIADSVDYFKSDAGLATSHLKDTVVTLPEGMTLNPSAADGQGACSMAEIGVTDTNSSEAPAIRFNNAAVDCPESSKVAEVVVETPLLEEADWPEGSVYLAKQGENPFNSDFAIYIAIESPDRGVIVKLAGKVEPDPVTGRLTTTFVENPQLPFDKFRLRFKPGPRAPLATPTTCGTHTNVTDLTPYSDPDNAVEVPDPFEIDSSPAGGCPATKGARPFNLGFSAGSTEIVGGAHSPFTVRLTRPDGNQEFGNVEVTTPPGFAAKLAGVATCSDASVSAAEARTATGDGAKEQQSPSCPEASKIGTTTIGVGAGSSPFYAKGNVYLAGPYKGAPLSLAFIVPAVAGPFDLGVQVVRAAVKVNPVTAQITTSSDAIPQILEGVPLRIRDIRVDVDRKDFAINPTDCSEKLVTGKVTGSHGATTEVSNRFQVAECARLAFKPQVSLQLFGGVTRAKYQGVRAIVRPRAGDANISGATVRFPSSAFVAQEHLQNICTRVQWAADACPKNSVYGTAEAISPLLDEPLKGNVHLRSSNNLLPDLVADLRGPDHRPIRVEVAIRNDSVKGALRNTVDVAPDTPVTYFRIQVFGGKKALITNSRNICKDKNAARVSFRAHNGRSSVQSVAVRNAKCGKWRKAQKRKVAKRKAAAKRKARAQQRH